MWGCFLMSGVKILHFLKDWWKSIPIHQNYTMALKLQGGHYPPLADWELVMHPPFSDSKTKNWQSMILAILGYISANATTPCKRNAMSNVSNKMNYCYHYIMMEIKKVNLVYNIFYINWKLKKKNYNVYSRDYG